MTEAEWLACEKPDLLLRHLKAIGVTRWQRGKRRRKLRLLACAVFGLTRHLLSPDHGWRAIDLAERYADGLTDLTELTEGLKEVHNLRRQESERVYAARRQGAERVVTPQYAAEAALWGLLTDNDLDSAELSLTESIHGLVQEASPAKPNLFRKALRQVQARLLRDIFGNPFCPVAFDPRWRTEDVLGLARGIYEDRAFDRLPLLADALMDAGCDSDDVLNHCRSEGPHVRGCWVVDLVLGTE